MKDLKIGNRYDNKVFSNWYKEIIEIVDRQPTKAIVKSKDDNGEIWYTHFQKENGEWKAFVTGRSDDRFGLLYGGEK